MKKRLYIETVGCQMNVLDSELVVASLRKAGYELVDTPGQGRHDPVQHVQRPAARRGQDLQRPGPAEARQDAQPAQDHRRAGLHGPEGPEADLRAGAARRPGRRARASCTRFPTLIERDRRRRRAADGSEPRPQGRQPRAKSSAASRATIRCAIPPMRPTPFQAFVRIMIGCDKFCTYCIVPSVRGPGAEPAGRRTSWPRSGSWPTRAASRSRCWARRSTATSTRPAAAPRGCPTCWPQLHEIDGHRAAQVRHQLSQGHDRRPARRRSATCPRCSPYLHVPAQSGSNRVLQRMKRGYTVEEYREMLARIRETIPDAAVTSDFIVGFCGETEEDFQQTVDLVRESRFKNSFIFKYSPAPGHQGRRPVRRRRARGGEAAPQQRAAGRCRTRSARKTTSRSSAARWRCWSKARARPRRNATTAADARATGRPHALRPDRGLRRQPPRRSASCSPVTIYDANAFTLFGERGHRARRAGSVQSVSELTEHWCQSTCGQARQLHWTVRWTSTNCTAISIDPAAAARWLQSLGSGRRRAGRTAIWCAWPRPA